MTVEVTRLTNESDAYRRAREELRLAEIELMRHRERVAELRRQLPPGAVVEDYWFEEGPADLEAGDAPVRKVRLEQDSTISVFTRAPDGIVRHFYTGHPWLSPEIDQRGIDLLSPVWHLLDLTPSGRDDWYAELSYPDRTPSERQVLS